MIDWIRREAIYLWYYLDIQVRQIAPYWALGILLTALYQIHVPGKFVSSLFGKNEGFGVLMAATIGVPLYMCGGGTIPLLQQWLVDGMSMGSAAAFMITGRRGARIFDSTVRGFSLCEKL